METTPQRKPLHKGNYSTKETTPMELLKQSITTHASGQSRVDGEKQSPD